MKKLLLIVAIFAGTVLAAAPTAEAGGFGFSLLLGNRGRVSSFDHRFRGSRDRDLRLLLDLNRRNRFNDDIQRQIILRQLQRNRGFRSFNSCGLLY